jgi:hypothetical protein
MDLASDLLGHTSHIVQLSYEKWESLQQCLVFLCRQIWNVVENVLCNDSPEGLLSQGLDEDGTIDTKDILNYAFRAVHESRYGRNIL